MANIRNVTDPLRPHVYNAWHEAYIEIQADPTDNRTDKKFAEDYGIHASTLSQWKREFRNRIFAEVNTRRKTYIAELRSRAYKALYGKMSTDTNALKLAFQLMGDLIERTESKVEYMTKEEKVQRINDLLKSIGAKKDQWGVVQDGRKDPDKETRHEINENISKDVQGKEAAAGEPNVQPIVQEHGPAKDTAGSGEV